MTGEETEQYYHLGIQVSRRRELHGVAEGTSSKQPHSRAHTGRVDLDKDTTEYDGLASSCLAVDGPAHRKQLRMGIRHGFVTWPRTW